MRKILKAFWVVGLLSYSLVYAEEVAEESTEANNTDNVIKLPMNTPQTKNEGEDKLFLPESYLSLPTTTTLSTKKEDEDQLFLPQKPTSWSIRPKLLTGVMYFKHMTLDKAILSNKPVPFAGIGLNITFNNWFLNGYGLDSAKATDHIFKEENKTIGLSEANYNFQRQDYAVTLGREITDWLFTDPKDWGISLFTGYRQGKTNLHAVNVKFSGTVNDSLTLMNGEYTVKGPMAGIGLRMKLPESNSQLGLTVGYGPLHGTYTSLSVNQFGGSPQPDTKNNTVSTWVTALNWEGELTPNLSYSLVFDYYAYSMIIPQSSTTTYNEIKEAVGSAKLFLNYRF